MPHVPELQAHDTHDLELVAAFAGRALDGRELEEATVLVARCTACAELHADLRAISAAVPALPVPPRRRDYRLTQEQAAALRPSGWRRILAAFASPRFSFAAPLGTGLATLGLAGLLLAAMPGAIPLPDGATVPGIMSERQDLPADQSGEGPATPGKAAPTPGDVMGNGAPDELGGSADRRLAEPAGWILPLSAVSVMALLLGLGLVAGRMLARRGTRTG
jgi:hypothetical protein